MSALLEGVRSDASVIHESLYRHIEVIKRVFDIPKRGTIAVYPGESTLNIVVFTLSGGRCADFTFFFDYEQINVENVYGCNRGGNEILKSIEMVARQLKIKQITIGEDTSYIMAKGCSEGVSIIIDLAMLNILSSGESWYNRYGYKQPSYERDVEHNKEIIQERILDLVEGTGIESPIFDRVLRPLPRESIRSYFSKIHKHMKAGIYKCDQLRIVARFIDEIAGLETEDGRPFFSYFPKNLRKNVATAEDRIWKKRELTSTRYSISLANPNKRSYTKRSVKSLPTRLTRRKTPSPRHGLGETAAQLSQSTGRGGNKRNRTKKNRAI